MVRIEQRLDQIVLTKYKKKATEDQFNELHNLVTKEFLARIKSGEASTARSESSLRLAQNK